MASSALTLGKYHLLKSASSIVGAGGKLIGTPAINKLGEKAYPLLSKFLGNNPSSAFQRPSLQKWAKAHQFAQSKKELIEGKKLFEIKKNVPSSSPATIPTVASDIKNRESEFLKTSGKDLSSANFTIPKDNLDKSYGYIQKPMLAPKITQAEANMWKHLNSDSMRFKSIKPQSALQNSLTNPSKALPKTGSSISDINNLGTVKKYASRNESVRKLQNSRMDKYKNIKKETRSEA